MAVTERLDRFQRKHPWAAFPLAVAYKYFDDFGAYLAALLTYYGFVSLATAGLAVLGTTALSIAGGGGAVALGTAGRSLTLASSVVINIAMAIFAFRFAPARRLSVRDVVPGAIATAVIWQLLQSFRLASPAHGDFFYGACAQSGQITRYNARCNAQ